jgi:hypothetical protein
VDHTSRCEQATKGPRHSKRHICQNCPDDVCREHNQHKHHLCMKQEEDESGSIDYIVVAMRDNLDDRIAHAIVCSSHRYEHKKMIEKMMTQSCQTLQPSNIINDSSCKNMLRIF